MSILAPIFVAGLLLALQGPLLQFSCAFAGGRAPGYWRALATAILAGCASTVAATTWSWTGGLLVSLFVSSWLAWGIGVTLGGLVSSLVYRGRLHLPFAQAVAVTLVHSVLSSGVTAAAWYLYRLI